VGAGGLYRCERRSRGSQATPNSRRCAPVAGQGGQVSHGQGQTRHSRGQEGGEILEVDRAPVVERPPSSPDARGLRGRATGCRAARLVDGRGARLRRGGAAPVARGETLVPAARWAHHHPHRHRAGAPLPATRPRSGPTRAADADSAGWIPGRLLLAGPGPRGRGRQPAISPHAFLPTARFATNPPTYGRPWCGPRGFGRLVGRIPGAGRENENATGDDARCLPRA
jgi:hypothetical protein